MTSLVSEIATGLEPDLSRLQGYSDEEIEKIESFYNIKVAGDLRRLLVEFGRSTGNVLLPDLVFYQGYYIPKTPALVSGHLSQQLEFQEDLLRFGRPFRSGNPFLISIENDTQYYFLRTRADEPLKATTPEDDYSHLSDDPEIVYRFDENAEAVTNTNIKLRDYLKSQIRPSDASRTGMGELIRI